MRKTILFEQEQISADALRTLERSLKAIEQKLENEVAAKQRTISQQEQELQQLRSTLHETNLINLDLENKMKECQRNSEGNRQLINKLLNDIERLQQDVEWYKRTYETRSLLGTIKQKVFGQSVKRK